MVTALQLEHSSMTNIFSSPVPKCSYLIIPALPSFSAVTSSNRGMILAPVAIAISSMSTPPTHRTAGNLFWSKRWFASSSNPHWQRATLHPLFWRCSIISLKYFCSNWYSFLNDSALVMSILCFVFGFGASNGQVKIAILASLTYFGIWGWEKSLSIRIPSNSWVSSMLPPVFYWILIKSRLTSFLSRSATERTAFTAIFPNFFWSLLTILDPRETHAASTSSEYSSLVYLISSAI